eukprot:TRINITY_DN3138_c0_g1_i1.p1 TRINITY_DN3138_c0_g1~~TRINITY_DN3138_c0_g1_i1.p1  ORF type:complete len:313 (+),score=74.27 TRINITY_DN3138_c0_g1_i1:814-1752(+)
MDFFSCHVIPGSEFGRSPQPIPHTNSFVFLQVQESVRAHVSCSSLMKFDSEKNETVCLVPIARHASKSRRFAGIYCQNLPKNACISEKFVIFSSVYMNQTVIYCVRVCEGDTQSSIHPISPNILTHNYDILGVCEDGVVVSFSTPVCAPAIFFVPLRFRPNAPPMLDFENRCVLIDHPPYLPKLGACEYFVPYSTRRPTKQGQKPKKETPNVPQTDASASEPSISDKVNTDRPEIPCFFILPENISGSLAALGAQQLHTGGEMKPKTPQPQDISEKAEVSEQQHRKNGRWCCFRMVAHTQQQQSDGIQRLPF